MQNLGEKQFQHKISIFESPCWRFLVFNLFPCEMFFLENWAFKNQAAYKITYKYKLWYSDNRFITAAHQARQEASVTRKQLTRYN